LHGFDLRELELLAQVTCMALTTASLSSSSMPYAISEGSGPQSLHIPNEALQAPWGKGLFVGGGGAAPDLIISRMKSSFLNDQSSM
jgi:hypothetical protein